MNLEFYLMKIKVTIFKKPQLQLILYLDYGFMTISASLSPIFDNNPSFLLFQFLNNFTLINYEKYYTDLYFDNQV